jgi:hypothetical protein
MRDGLHEGGILVDKAGRRDKAAQAMSTLSLLEAATFFV